MRNLAALALAVSLSGQIREHKAPGKELPHDRYLRVVSEKQSPVETAYIKTKDGLYVAAAIRRPSAEGRFPAVVYFHGAPGGRGMEKLVSWSRGETGSPVWERLLSERYVVVIADYRNNATARDDIIEGPRVSYVDDGAAVLEYVRKLPYVKPESIALYGVSRGGNLAVHLAGRIKVAATILGAPAVTGLFGVERRPANSDPAKRYQDVKLNADHARSRIGGLQGPVLILVGTKDSLLEVDRALYYLLATSGKKVQLEIYENGYHDFCIGPQGNAGFHQPLTDATLAALELTIEFLEKYVN